MAGLPVSEFMIFITAAGVYIAAAIVCVLQIIANGKRKRLTLTALVGIAVLLEILLLALRGISIHAVPLTELFESIILLTIVFGIMYLFLSFTIRRIWFDSVMVWIILLIVLIAGSVAAPPSQPRAIAATPWAIAHGITMILGVASLTFAAANAVLYLLGRNKLKKKNFVNVLGKMPNLEKLELMNIHSLEFCFLFITFGMISGIGMAAINSAALGVSFVNWLFDSKIILIVAIWSLCGITIILKRKIVLKGGGMAYLTITAFIFILFAIVGTAIFCGTSHNFISPGVSTLER
ncbi:MAG: cytochrome c biogenesis protein CcsA [Phycisphaerae bacterium]|nr:cytochrome c biogenesis protein CcsA [Phycisphaerae bacterium]